MIKLSKMTDYGVVVAAQIARHPETIHTAPEIAAATGLAMPTVSKLLKILTRHELLVSRRGARGGYVLARAPEAITMADLVAAFDGPVALTACIDVEGDGCDVERMCPMSQRWARLNRAIRDVLASMSLAEMIAPGDAFTAPGDQFAAPVIAPPAPILDAGAPVAAGAGAPKTYEN